MLAIAEEIRKMKRKCHSDFRFQMQISDILSVIVSVE